MIILELGDKLRGDATAANVIDYTIHGIVGTTITQMVDGQLAASITDIYTASGICVVKTITIVNTDTVSRNINLYITPSGGTARRLLPKDVTLNAGYSLTISESGIQVIDTSGNIMTAQQSAISDAVYAADWENITTVGASKNALFTKLEIMLTAIGLNTAKETNIVYPAETATTIGAAIGGAADATPNDSDFVATSLTGAGILKKITWTAVKAFLKTYFDGLYPSGSGTSSGANTGDQIASGVTNTPTGTIAATDVQAAITELDADGTLLRNRATAIETDIDYPTSIKQKSIVDTGEDGGVEGGVFNGDFEYGSGSTSSNAWIGDEDYGWYFSKSGTVSASYDTDSYSGSKCLKASISAASSFCEIKSFNTAALQGNRISIIPNQKYRLSCYMKMENMTGDSDAGAKLICLLYNSSDTVSTSGATGWIKVDSDWTYYENIFTSSAASLYGVIRCDFYGHTGTGTLEGDAFFDNIKLEQIDTTTVNTQADVLAGVSITGVTTTDNIDQNQLTVDSDTTIGDGGGNEYDYARIFTPTTSKLTKVVVKKSSSVGTPTGNLVFSIVEDNATAPTGTVLATKSYTQAVWDALDNGDIEIDLPCILTIGDIYWIKIVNDAAEATDVRYKLRKISTGLSGSLYLSTNGGAFTTMAGQDLYFKTLFAKHTESPIVEVNGNKLDLTGTKLLSGATITVNADGSGKYEYYDDVNDYGVKLINDLESYSIAGAQFSFIAAGKLLGDVDNSLVWKHDLVYPAISSRLITVVPTGTTRSANISYSYNGVDYTLIYTGDTASADSDKTIDISIPTNFNSVIYLKFDMNKISTNWAINDIRFIAELDCSTALPILCPTSEVSTESSDLVQNPIDISEDGYWPLKYDLTGWSSHTFSMIASEASWESQAVSADTIYMYDSNGTTPWTWDERNGLVPPADRTAGTVTAKFIVGDNQIRCSVNDGSMKANVTLSWAEPSIRKMLNELLQITNTLYPVVVEVQDVGTFDVQLEPTGATANTGYTNDATSLRQTTASAAAIAYIGLLPSENRFTEWLDITVVCNDGDGTLQGKLYTMDGTLIETYADLMTNPVISISNPDYKYSRERLVLQISASAETTATAWSVTSIKWRYQWNG